MCIRDREHIVLENDDMLAVNTAEHQAVLPKAVTDRDELVEDVYKRQALGFVSGRGVDKLGNIRHKVLIEGVPVIKENTCCWFLCKVQEKLDLPGQVVFVAEIIAGSDEAVGTPMTYKYYVEQLGGASPCLLYTSRCV